MEMHHVVFPFNSDVEQTKAPHVLDKVGKEIATFCIMLISQKISVQESHLLTTDL